MHGLGCGSARLFFSTAMFPPSLIAGPSGLLARSSKVESVDIFRNVPGGSVMRMYLIPFG
jgi:hypothetical protein